jgi:diguanylate cyclase (GGDEF)-like protein
LWLARLGYYSVGLVSLGIWVYQPTEVKLEQLLALICALTVFAHVSYMLDRRVYTRAMMRVANTDTLTALPNRRHFMQTLEEALKRKRFALSRNVALYLIDLDRFKLVNDSFGHEAGDHFLIEVSTRLNNVVATTDTLARLGGDEFVLVRSGTRSDQDVEHLAQRMLDALEPPIQIGQQRIWPSASIGIAVSRPGDGGPEELLRRADTAMYSAKENGRNAFLLYSANNPAPKPGRLSRESQLREAILNRNLALYYQPLFTLNPLRLKGFEALVRWQDPKLGLIPPSEFVPMAEEAGLIHELSRWVLQEACEQVLHWEELYGVTLPVSVNLSASDFRRVDFLDEVTSTLSELRVPTDRIILELTESVLLRDPDKAAHVLREIRKLGVRIAIDDFGTGYSSLSYLSQFPADILKIDQSFVRDSDGEKGKAILASIVNLGHALGMTVVAEGIETPLQLTTVITSGCDIGQGYFLSKPEGSEAIHQMLSSQKYQLASPAITLAETPDAAVVAA